MQNVGGCFSRGINVNNTRMCYFENSFLCAIFTATKKYIIMEPEKNPKNLIAANNTSLSSLSNESTINLEFHVKDVDPANREIDECKNQLRISKTLGGVDVNVDGDQVIDTIIGCHFLGLYNVAQELSGSGCYLTGLKIIFGINNNNEICLVYQPVLLQNEQETSPDSKVCSYRIIESSSCFQYDKTDGFKNCSGKGDLVAAYKSKIKIKHNATETHSPFLPGVDVESMVFSFQEIFALMYENRKAEADQNIFYKNNDPVLIYNCIRENSIDPSFKYKHSLLLSTVASSKMKEVGFSGKFANLAHLCPPNCKNDSFIFRLESIQSDCD